MNKFFLPKLEQIEINCYALYECPLVIDFTKKLNIIFGTNGTGKSTLLMIILFSMIGPYRGGIKTKTRKNQRKDNRPIYDDDFFRNRMIDNVDTATVISKFRINEDLYEVKHSLYDGKLLKVILNEIPLEGKIITYHTYESKFSKMRENVKSNDENLESYLIYEYQNAIKKSTGLPGGVNTLINMMLDIMFFDEGRSFTFWNPDLQETIIGKYIVDEDFYESYCEKKLDTKALESAYKKISETLNYMKKFFEEEQKNANNFINKDNPEIDLLNLIDDIADREEELNNSRNEYGAKNSEAMKLSEEIEKIQEQIKKLDEIWYSNLFPKQYNSYHKKFSGKMSEDICPICGKPHVFMVNTGNCIFCNETLDIDKTPDLIDIDIQRKDFKIKLTSKTKNLKLLQSELNEINIGINNLRKDIERKNREKNKIEILIHPRDNEQDSDSIRLKRAAEDRAIALKRYNYCKKEEIEMRKKIEQGLVKNFKEFSSSFKRFANSFFGVEHEVKIELPFSKIDSDDDSSEKLMIEFKLNGKSRQESYMLSESQRIFTDLAFRFAVLTTFHENSFFMCETPDSTLDVFHEKNAVDTFKHYINAGNTLILTANARKSNLIANLYSQISKDEITVIDLTQISKVRLPLIVSFSDYVGGNL